MKIIRLILVLAILPSFSACTTSQKTVVVTTPQKVLPHSSLNDDEWYYQYYKKNNHHISSYFPHKKNWGNSLNLVREAYKRKGHLTDQDIYLLMGKPLYVKRMQLKDSDRGVWDSENWIYSGYRVIFSYNPSKLNRSKFAECRAHHRLGNLLSYNSIKVK